MNRFCRTTAAAVAMIVISAGALAEDIRVAVRALPTSMDPHYHVTPQNRQVHAHVFETLIGQDASQQPVPALAVAWKAIDDKTWEFNLRKNVRWHDGSPFTADDVTFTFKRAVSVPESPSSFAAYIKGKTATKVDDHTIRIATESPYPLMVQDLAMFVIVSKKHGEAAATKDYNDGKATIGTGPYKFVEWVAGDRLTLVANPDWWGGKPKWDRVVWKPISSGTTRVAALLNGDTDLIDYVPTNDIGLLRKNPKIVVSPGVSNRVMYIMIDHDRDQSPGVRSASGEPMLSNPLRNLDVRKAMSIAIDRKAIEERVMEGLAVPTGQIVPEGFFAYDPSLKVEPYDPEGAKKLLAKAGLANGFQLTLAGSNDRYVNDSKVVEAIAAMWTRIGIKTDVLIMPGSVFFTRGTKRDFSAGMYGLGAFSGDPVSPMKVGLATFDTQAGFGSANRGRYSNKNFDDLLSTALVTLDDNKRRDLLIDATRVVIKDLGFIPLYHEVSIWASRQGLKYLPRTDEQTLVEEVVKQN
jgi:peptide/nickel transport system substrate-binding protein